MTSTMVSLLSQQKVAQSAVIDGFSMDGSILWQAPDYRPYAIERLDLLRSVQGFVPRAYVAPETSQTPLQNGNTAFTQLRMPLGTIVWGYMIQDVGDALSDESWQVSETRGRRLFSEPESATPGYNSQFGVFLLLQPFVVASTADLNVEIYKGIGSASNATVPMQVVLLCAEPTDKQECAE